MRMIPIDKQLHFFSGWALMLSVSLFFGWQVGLAVTVLAAVAKEVWDSMGHGTADLWDAAATVLGGLVGTVLIMIKEWI